MQIIEVNHKTVGNLLKKSVEKSWMDDNLDAWFQFTDGSTVCIHVIETNWARTLLLIIFTKVVLCLFTMNKPSWVTRIKKVSNRRTQIEH